MKQKSKYLVASGLSVGVVCLLLTAGISFAADDATTEEFDPKAKHEEMKEIVDNGDYSAWETIMNEKVDQMINKAEELEATINEETFVNIQEVHALMQAGDFEGAKELKEELGLDSFGKGHMKGEFKDGKGFGPKHGFGPKSK